MIGLLRLTRLIERRLGNAGLGLVAAILLLGSILGAFSVTGSSGSSKAASPTTTTVTIVQSTTSSSVVGTSTTATTAPPASTTTAPAQPTRNGVNGYAAVTFNVSPAAGQEKKFCGLLASSASQQATGLMNQDGLSGYDGMVFAFSADTTAAFYMANVPQALSVAWFDKDGKFVSSADMEPCKVEASKCQLYKATGPYRSAVETLKGNMGSLGITSGSALSIGSAGPC